MSLRLLPTLFIAASVGCLPTPPERPANDDDDDGGSDATLVSTVPEDGTDDWFYRDPFVLEWDAPPGEVSVRVVNLPGDDPHMTIDIAPDGPIATVTPTRPLIPSSPYRLDVTWSGKIHTTEFQTSSYGVPLADLELVLEKTFFTNLDAGVVVKPSEWQQFMGGNSAFGWVAITPLPNTDGDVTLDYRLLYSPSINQSSSCIETTEPGGVRDHVWQNPYFGFSIPTSAPSHPPFEATTITGAYSESAGSIGKGTFTSRWDTRPSAAALGDDPGAVCDDLGPFLDAECEPCSDGGVYCLALQITDLTWESVEGWIERRTCSDILADSSCEEHWGTWDPDGDGRYELCP